MRRALFWGLLITGSLALIPPVLIARARAVQSARPRLNPVPDMDNQPRFKAQQANPLFADRRAMRRPVPGTVARGDLGRDEHYAEGLVASQPATTFPVPVTAALLRRGQERYEIFCAPCHGLSGYGDGPVARRAEELGEGTWVPPPSFHQDLVRQRTHGELFQIITHGIRKMPAYGSQIPVEDRWAIVAYLRALQRSQHARLEDVPPELRQTLPEVQPK